MRAAVVVAAMVPMVMVPMVAASLVGVSGGLFFFSSVPVNAERMQNITVSWSRFGIIAASLPFSWRCALSLRLISVSSRKPIE